MTNNDDSIVYVLTGDGELQEGQNWEALMFAAAKNVDNIIVTVDLNGQQIDGSTKDVLDIGNLNLKLESFGWEVLEIKDGNSLDEIYQVFINAKANAKAKNDNILSIGSIVHKLIEKWLKGEKVTKPEDKNLFEKLLQNGNQWGLNIHYKTQASPRGIAEALILGEDFLNKSCCSI